MKDEKVTRIKNNKRFPWLGLIFFGLICVYIVINLIRYAGKDPLDIYEITGQGKDSSMEKTAFILREESLVFSQKEGYPRYYVAEGDKVAKNGNVCSITESNDIYSLYADVVSEKNLSRDDMRALKDEVLSFRNSFSGSDYSDVALMNQKIVNTVNYRIDNRLLSEMEKIISKTGTDISFSNVYIPETGLISYNSDNYTGYVLEDITEDCFDREKLTSESLKNLEKMTTGQTLFRLVTSEDWKLVFPLTGDEYINYSDKSSLKITVSSDKRELKCKAEYVTIHDRKYCVLSLSNYIVPYLSERLLDITVSESEPEGLRIVKSAIGKKEFFVIPIEYLLSEQDSSSRYLNLVTYDEVTGEELIKEYSVTPFHISETKFYLDKEDIEAGRMIISSENERMMISAVELLDGVYKVNKGYCDFTYVEKIDDIGDYYLVKTGGDNTVRLYDHIALDASKAVGVSIIY